MALDDLARDTLPVTYLTNISVSTRSRSTVAFHSRRSDSAAICAWRVVRFRAGSVVRCAQGLGTD